MRVLLVSEYFYPHAVGGVAEHVFHLRKELIKSGHTVEILTGGKGEGAIRAGRSLPFPLNYSISRFSFSPFILSTVKQVVRSKWDIIHIHGALSPTLPLLALKYSNSVNIFTFHAGFKKSIPLFMLKRPLQKYIKKIHGVIAVSEEAAISMKRYFSFKYSIIPNGIDTKVFKYKHLSSLDDIRILFIGRLERKKGVHVLLKALNRLKSYPYKVKIIGNGPMEKWAKWYTEKYKLNVEFISTLTGDRRIPHFHWANMIVIPSIGGESFGIVILEAMSSGRPAIVSNIPGFVEVMDKRAGLLFEAKNADSLAQSIITLFENKKKWKEMSSKAREISLKYSWNKVAQRVVEFYREVLCQH